MENTTVTFPLGLAGGSQVCGSDWGRAGCHYFAHASKTAKSITRVRRQLKNNMLHLDLITDILIIFCGLSSIQSPVLTYGLLFEIIFYIKNSMGGCLAWCTEVFLKCLPWVCKKVRRWQCIFFLMWTKFHLTGLLIVWNDMRCVSPPPVRRYLAVTTYSPLSTTSCLFK